MNDRETAVVRAEVLRAAADHLEEARSTAWNNAQRKVSGWASAAAELRRLADQELKRADMPPS